MTQEQDEVLNEEDTGVEVEIDAPEEQESAVTEKVAVEEGPGEDELESYSQKVQGRIKKLTEKYRKEERDREEAVSMSQKLLAENNKLKSQVKNLDKGYVSSEESRLKSEVASVKQKYREAYESGDSDGMFSAQEQLSQMTLMQERSSSTPYCARAGTCTTGTADTRACPTEASSAGPSCPAMG